MAVKSLLKFLCGYKSVLVFLILPCLLWGEAKKETAYEHLMNQSDGITTTHSAKGWGYVISGGAALAASVPGYYLSDDIFARTIYSLGQTIGVGAIGYGAYLILVDDEIVRFRKILAAQTGLSDAQKSALARSFLEETAAQAKRTRHLRSLTHGMMAGLNLLNALTASQRELKTALFFFGGVNTLVSLTSLLSPSDEEKNLVENKFAFSISPVHVALAVRF